MALKTIGTNATTSLTGFIVGTNDVIAADVATLLTSIKRDPPGYQFWQNVTAAGVPTGAGSNRPLVNQAYRQTGTLIVPGRGILQAQPGDFVAFDATTGWPILISGDAAANGPYTHS